MIALPEVVIGISERAVGQDGGELLTAVVCTHAGSIGKGDTVVKEAEGTEHEKNGKVVEAGVCACASTTDAVVVANDSANYGSMNQSSPTRSSLSVVTSELKVPFVWKARIPESKEDLDKMLRELNNNPQLIVPEKSRPKLVPSNSKASVKLRLKRIQDYISSFEYNHTGRRYFSVRKDMGAQKIVSISREIIRECLPIKCVEAVFMAFYLTLGMRDKLVRIPIRFQSSNADNYNKFVFRHIVMAVFSPGDKKWGALGLSRKSTLMYKELRFPSFSALLKDFQESYHDIGHKVDHAGIGLPFGFDEHSVGPIQWRPVMLHFNDTQTWNETTDAAIDLYAECMHSITTHFHALGRLPDWYLNKFPNVTPGNNSNKDGNDESKFAASSPKHVTSPKKPGVPRLSGQSPKSNNNKSAKNLVITGDDDNKAKVGENKEGESKESKSEFCNSKASDHGKTDGEESKTRTRTNRETREDGNKQAGTTSFQASKETKKQNNEGTANVLEESTNVADSVKTQGKVVDKAADKNEDKTPVKNDISKKQSVGKISSKKNQLPKAASMHNKTTKKKPADTETEQAAVDLKNSESTISSDSDLQVISLENTSSTSSCKKGRAFYFAPPDSVLIEEHNRPARPTTAIGNESARSVKVRHSSKITSKNGFLAQLSPCVSPRMPRYAKDIIFRSIKLQSAVVKIKTLDNDEMHLHSAMALFKKASRHKVYSECE